jgi:chromate transporter
MPSDSLHTGEPPPDSPASHPPSESPTLAGLFLAFAKMSLAGFGGVLVWARRGIVEQHRWMTADEFNETFALCHFLPGPNIVNLSVVFGSRFGGIAGGLAAFAGLIGPPMLIAIVLAALYARFGEFETLRRILAGVSCAAVGLLIAVVLRMMMPLVKKRDVAGLLMLMAVFIAIGILRLPLQVVLLIAIPLSLFVTWYLRTRSSRT